MRKIHTLLSEHAKQKHNPLSTLTAQAESHLKLQQFWSTAAPSAIASASTAVDLRDGKLTVHAINASIASKIKFTHSSLLSQLQNLQLSTPQYRECKVTLIVVKVQAKSIVPSPSKAPRRLSAKAAERLENLASQLGDSALAERLIHLAKQR